jgi:Calcium-activated chloride channel
MILEMHRTQTEFDDNLTFKVFIFQFVNFYSSIFYIAFFKGRFVGYPGSYSHILRLRNEDVSDPIYYAFNSNRRRFAPAGRVAKAFECIESG